MELWFYECKNKSRFMNILFKIPWIFQKLNYLNLAKSSLNNEKPIRETKILSLEGYQCQIWWTIFFFLLFYCLSCIKLTPMIFVSYPWPWLWHKDEDEISVKTFLIDNFKGGFFFSTYLFIEEGEIYLWIFLWSDKN